METPPTSAARLAGHVRPWLAGASGWVAVYAALVAAWIAVWLMDPRADLPPEMRALGFDALAALCLAAAEDASFPGLWAMWAVMGAAMMLPTAIPALRAFDQLTATVAARGGATAFALPALAAGFVTVWAGFAVVAAGAQVALTHAGWLDIDRGVVNAPGVAGALMIVAGAYQFSALKEACVSRCRMPMPFFIAAWRPGAGAAYAMGLRLGADCLGCCWALMLLAFVGGTTNLMFMGGATILMMLEKLPRLGRPLTRPVGFALISAGIGLAALAILQSG